MNIVRPLQTSVSCAVLAFIAILTLQHSTVLAQGSLTPPGAPAPTMKTLDQIEPRIPISATTTPGDTSDSFIITNPGSYYLTTNFIASSSKNGIRIATNNVTIDLNGFGFDGAGQGGLGIRIITSIRRQNITVRNGSVRNWTSTGIELSFGLNVFVENVLVTGNGGNGIEAGENSVIKDCLAYTNANSGSFLAGITTTQGSVVENCAADFNGNNVANCFGISVGLGSTVSHCSASQNNGPTAIGIGTSAYCTVVDCAVSFASGTNGFGIWVGKGCSVARCTASGNSGSGTVGIFADQYSSIENCVAANNGGDGVQTSNNCSVIANTCCSNAGAGVHITGMRNRIDGNNVALNAAGIKVDSNLNLIIRNSASGSSVNDYVIAAGNNDAERVVGGTAFTSTDPWANFAF
jgi:hypothetical protein